MPPSVDIGYRHSAPSPRHNGSLSYRRTNGEIKTGWPKMTQTGHAIPPHQGRTNLVQIALDIISHRIRMELFHRPTRGFDWLIEPFPGSIRETLRPLRVLPRYFDMKTLSD